jgi:hypothetical protein
MWHIGGEATPHLNHTNLNQAMQTIFVALYKLHPVLPALWLLVFAHGLLAPAIFCMVKKLPYDIGLIWKQAKDGNSGARYAIGSWLSLAIAGIGALLAVWLQ